MRLRGKKVRVLLILACLLALSPLLLLAHPRARAAFRITPDFRPLESEARVFYEPGAEAFAAQFARVLPGAMARVEQAHAAPLEPGFRVYVTASHESFAKHLRENVESPVRGMALYRDVWLSPLAFDFRGRDTHSQTLAHELSHLLLSQYLGNWRRIRNVPAWLAEGLADWAADTGGEIVSRRQAVAAIVAGHALVPDSEGSFLLPKRARHYGLRYPMLHQQSRMFFEYLHERDAQALRQFVTALLAGTSVDAGLRESFGKDLSPLWQEFLDSVELEAAGGHETTP